MTRSSAPPPGSTRSRSCGGASEQYQMRSTCASSGGDGVRPTYCMPWFYRSGRGTRPRPLTRPRPRLRWNATAEQQRHDREDEEHEEQDLRDAHGAGGKSTEAEDGGDQRDDE